MAFAFDSRINPELMGIAWMIGHWEGTGSVQPADSDPVEFSIIIDFTENGGNYLHYIMQVFETDEEGKPTRSYQMETGFWRPKADGTVEVILVYPEGIAEVYIGRIDGARVELTTDVVARTVTADVPVTGGHRLYGNVESDLMFAYDRGTADHELVPFSWARLKRA